MEGLEAMTGRREEVETIVCVTSARVASGSRRSPSPFRHQSGGRRLGRRYCTVLAIDLVPKTTKTRFKQREKKSSETTIPQEKTDS